jgi:hypothetical protein
MELLARVEPKSSGSLAIEGLLLGMSVPSFAVPMYSLTRFAVVVWAGI